MKDRNVTLYIAISVSVVATLVLTIGAFSGGLLLAPYVSGKAEAAPLPPAVQAGQPVNQLADTTDIVAVYEQVFIDLYQDTLPSVVNIQVTKGANEELLDRFNLPNPEDDLDIPPEFFNRGSGSGFVWDTKGHIITNYHVIAGATDIEVLFANDTSVQAEVIGSDPDADLAVIKVDLPTSALNPITLGDSDALEVGQLSIAIGNPFGQDFTMTSGIISGVGRTIRSGNSLFSTPEIIQTDAPINPGNSGGPLLTRQGEVIGINTQILSRSGSSSGVGFAVPINIAKRVVPTLIEGKSYQYPWLGISGNILTGEAVEFRGLSADIKGAVVMGVANDGPADDAGLQGRNESLDTDSDEFRFGGDVITAINGQPVHDMNDLITYLVKETAPGDNIKLDLIRTDGTEEQVEVTLGIRPSTDSFTSDNE